MPAADTVMLSETTDGDYLVRRFIIKRPGDTDYSVRYQINLAKLSSTLDGNSRELGDLDDFAADHSQNAVARGLGFGGDDREAFAYECVHQRRFADVGISDDIDETGLVHRMSVV